MSQMVALGSAQVAKAESTGERERLRYLEQLMERNWVPALKPMLPT